MARSRVQSHNTHCFLLPALNITRFAAPVEIMLTEMLFYATTKLAVIYKSWYIASDREKLESKNLLALKLVGVMAYAQWVLAYALLLKVRLSVFGQLVLGRSNLPGKDSMHWAF